MMQHLFRVSIALAVFSFCAFAQEQVLVEAASAQQNSGFVLWDTFAAGGWVMWPILFCLVAGAGYSLDRFFGLTNKAVISEELQNAYNQVLTKMSKGEKNVDLSPLTQGKNTPAERLFSRFLGRDLNSINLRDREEILQEYTEETLFHMQKNCKPLGQISQIAPLLGLFGTVVGMIDAFDRVALYGLGDPRQFAHGIFEALLTTGFGLGVAIPISFLYHHFSERATRHTLHLYRMLHELLLQMNRDSGRS